MSHVTRSYAAERLIRPSRYAHVMNDAVRPETFANLIRGAREAKGWSQEQLELATRGIAGEHVSVSTISRWERGQAGRPEPEHVRKVCKALGIDPRRAAVALGYLTQEEVEPRRGAELPADIEEVLTILEDPKLPQDDRNKWIDYLKYLHRQAQQQAS